MKTFTEQELSSVLKSHQLWLQGNTEGVKADLSRANLSEANLRGADLRGADLRGADLMWADLSEANLSEANLRGTDLSEANLSEANLRGTDLRGTDLRGTDLWDTLGNSKEIVTIQTELYNINITEGVIQIGCKNHSVDEWRDFTGRQILELDGPQALRWWKKYKDYVLLSYSLNKGD